MLSKNKISKAFREAFKHNSFDYLGTCSGGKCGQVVYIQCCHTFALNGKCRVYKFYGYDRYFELANGKKVWDSYDEESWERVFYTMEDAVRFAREIKVREIK